MGIRCHSLHDPRLDSSIPFWLRHYQKPMSKSACAIPDPLSCYHSISRFQTNPIIGAHQWKQFGDDENAFLASYKLVCNLDVLIFERDFMSACRPVKMIDEVYKLAIARDMQANVTSSDRNFVYSNQHCLYSQVCLVLQTKYYRLRSLRTGFAIDIEHIVQEVPKHEYNSRDPMMVKADEVVFESKGHPNCNHCIWFNAEFTKSSAWKNKQNTSRGVCQDRDSLFCLPHNNDILKAMLYATEPPMMLMQSKDECKEGHMLIDSIWHHRIGWILSSRAISCNWIDNFHELNKDFSRLQQMVKRDSWPTLSNEQVSKIFEGTNACAGHNSTFYDPNFESEDTAALWNSFVGELIGGHHQTKPRLNVFTSMTSKEDTSTAKDLPHITNSSTGFISRYSQDTWQELLLGLDGPWTRALMNHSKARSF